VPAPAAPTPGDFALVTVTHNSAAEVEALLRSAAQYLPGVRTVVVDCASADDTVAVARRFADAEVMALTENVGFGRANNRGLAEVSEPVAVLVNPDVELLDDSLRGLAAQAAGTGDRLLAPLVLYPDGRRQDTVHPLPASAQDCVRALVPGALLPGPVGVWLEPWRSPRPRQVGWAVGCALAARTDTLRRLGPFDESIFLYGEDMELGLRAAAAGVPTWFWPSARVCHHRAHSSAVAFGGEAFERLAAARHEVVRRRLGRRRAALDDALQALTFASRIVVKELVGRPAQRERAQLRAVASARRDGAGA
jgi:N-acetylglucosaminyl-diphospho-decaprenol L-rhamnosyltransferase